MQCGLHATKRLAMHACYTITCVFEKVLIICSITALVGTVIDPDWLLNGMQEFQGYWSAVSQVSDTE